MKKLMLTLAAAVGFSTSALMAQTVSDDAVRVGSSDATSGSPVVATETPEKLDDQPGGVKEPGSDQHPEKKEEGEEGQGGTTPPDLPGGGGGGGSDDTTVLTGVLTVNGLTANYDGGTLTSSNEDENVILALSNATVTVSDYTLYKSGDSTNENSCNFFALNAVVAAKTAAKIYIDNSTLYSNADGANCLFASGSNSTIYAYNCTLESTKSSSRGLDATYEGTVIASKMSIRTEKAHCAALATDRGNGYISVTDSALNTAGEGSPLVYSTGVIEANSVTGSSTGAQIASIEGLSTIRIKNADLSGSGLHASEPLANGVLIYQSNSGDSAEGTATFEVSDSTFTSAITNGAMFYITHSEAVITVQDTALEFDTSTNYLLKAAGNNGEHGWGTAGSNGAEVVFTAIDQKLVGNITVDGISSLDMYLVNSTYAGTFENDTTYTGDGDGIELFVNSNSTWTVTANCTLKSLTAAEGATIVDGNGKTVPVYNSTSGQTVVSGASNLKITVSNYSSGNFVATNITAFAIDRTAFEAKYGTSESEEGGSGSGESSGEDDGEEEGEVTKTYYFKPHAPTNAVVWVEYNGTKLDPDMGHKYWLDAYWTDGEGVTLDISYKAEKGYLFADGSSATNWTLTVTENKMELYPPAGFEMAYPAQAQSGSTYYLTLEEAIAAVGNRSKIDLTPAAQSNEQTIVDAAVTNESVFAALVSTNQSAKVTLATTTAGLYYWIQGGTDVGAVTNAGPAELSTDGGSVELSKPALDTTEGRAFFKVSAGVADPAQ